MEKKIEITIKDEQIRIDHSENMTQLEVVGALEVAKVNFRIDFIRDRQKIFLDKIEKQIDEVLACETKESLTKWLQDKRKV